MHLTSSILCQTSPYHLTFPFTKTSQLTPHHTSHHCTSHHSHTPKQITSLIILFYSLATLHVTLDPYDMPVAFDTTSTGKSTNNPSKKPGCMKVAKSNYTYDTFGNQDYTKLNTPCQPSSVYRSENLWTGSVTASDRRESRRTGSGPTSAGSGSRQAQTLDGLYARSARVSLGDSRTPGSGK